MHPPTVLDKFPAVTVITSHSAPETVTLAQFLHDNRDGMSARKKAQITRAIAAGREYINDASPSYTLKPAGVLTAAEVSAQWRADPRNPRVSGGFVVIYRGEACGWVLELTPESARTRVPDCIAVGADGQLFISTGGDPMAGAETWEAK